MADPPAPLGRMPARRVCDDVRWGFCSDRVQWTCAHSVGRRWDGGLEKGLMSPSAEMGRKSQRAVIGLVSRETLSSSQVAATTDERGSVWDAGREQRIEARWHRGAFVDLQKMGHQQPAGPGQDAAGVEAFARSAYSRMTCGSLMTV